ncbi:MAG TPA: hypothetical protein VK716_00570 [Terracidiphilus sp.]|jgi:hypothetical protein|nr:hypothetical protein [Terracidiphilus sp.]
MAAQPPKTPTLPASSVDFNSRRYAALARQFADNALAAKPNEQTIQQIIVTRQIELNSK